MPPPFKDNSGIPSDNVSLRDYFDTCLDALEQTVKTGFENIEQRTSERSTSIKEALTKSEQVLSVRLEAMNKFREQINDERQSFVKKDELTTLLKEFTAEIRPLQDKQFWQRGAIWAIGIGFSLVISAVGILMQFLR